MSKKSSSNYISKNDKLFVHLRDKWKCVNPKCGPNKSRLTIHHCYFFSEHGDNQPWNYVTLCERCQRRIHLYDDILLRGYCQKLAALRYPGDKHVCQLHSVWDTERMMTKRVWRRIMLVLEDHTGHAYHTYLRMHTEEPVESVSRRRTAAKKLS